MDAPPSAFFIEFGLFAGAALGFGFYQLWWLRRDRLKREAEERAKKESEESPGHAEGK